MFLPTTFKKKITKGVAIDRKGVPSTKFTFSEKDMNGNWNYLTFVTPGTFPCEKEDGFEFIPKSINGIYVSKNGQYTNVNIYGEAEVYDRNGRKINSVNREAEAQFKEVTGDIADLPF